MNYIVRWKLIGWAVLIACILMPISCKKGEEPGATSTTFNKRLLPTIKPAMTYEQIAEIAGAPGVRINENKTTSPPIVQYRWSGAKDSILTVNISDNRMIDATVLTPNRHTYLIQNNGEVSDITK
jgi:hypothetical protein